MCVCGQTEHTSLRKAGPTASSGRLNNSMNRKQILSILSKWKRNITFHENVTVPKEKWQKNHVQRRARHVAVKTESQQFMRIV